ncbi:hypothetical protein M231_06584 [Tremella mesenterica]|uniref:Uncharacterized protein n=1 Tax=Tremella mesenterica TaxID=5217 RepID=A0A4Q1BBF2_TREME|nr:hypothetical protein M231_06584 [Tremella mesenterica]
MTKHSATLHTPYHAVFNRKHREIQMWETLEGRDRVEEVALDVAGSNEEAEEETVLDGSAQSEAFFQWESDSGEEERQARASSNRTPQVQQQNLHTQLPSNSEPLNPIQQLIQEENQRQPTASDHLIAKMRERQAVSRAKMIKQYGRNHKRWEYSVGDKAALFVPAAHRPGAPASRIPCVICETFPENPHTYCLLCSEGVLVRLYRSKVLNPADDLELPVLLLLEWRDWAQQPEITLRHAAHKIFNVDSDSSSATAPSYAKGNLPGEEDMSTTSESQNSSDRRRHRIAKTPWPSQDDHSLENWSELDEDGQRVKAIIQARKLFKEKYGELLRFDRSTGQ